MSSTTKIQWADATFNPFIGCTKVSPGCANCYAEHSTPTRTKGIKWGKGQERQRTSESYWKQPLKWDRQWAELNRNISLTPRPRVFPSLCDWLDDEVPIEWLADFLKLIHDTPNLDWLLLTKRAENFEKRIRLAELFLVDGPRERDDPRVGVSVWLSEWKHGESTPANVWIGVSVEDQKRADERIPQLLNIPARIRFLSVEPLIAPVDLDKWILPTVEDAQAIYSGKNPEHPRIHWIIVGGESGPRARPCNVAWIRDILEQCKAADVPVFVKQVGSKSFIDPCPYCGHPEDSHGFGRTVGCQHGDGSEQNPICGCRKMKGEIMHGYGFPIAHHPVKHPKGGEPAEWPEDLRIRNFPILKP